MDSLSLRARRRLEILVRLGIHFVRSRCARNGSTIQLCRSRFARGVPESIFSLALRAMRVGFLLFRPRFARGGSNIHFCSLALRTRRLEILFPILIHFFRSRSARGGSTIQFSRSRFARGGPESIFVARAARDEGRLPFISSAFRARRVQPVSYTHLTLPTISSV